MAFSGPGGFRALRSEANDKYTGGPTREYDLSSDATTGSTVPIAMGDVMLALGSTANSRTNDGRRSVDGSGTTILVIDTAIAGIVTGFKVDPDEIYQNGLNTGSTGRVRVNTSPDTLYEIAIDDTTPGNVTMAYVGRNADINIVVSERINNGAMYISNTSMSSTAAPDSSATRPLRIERLFNDDPTQVFATRAWVRLHGLVYNQEGGITLSEETVQEMVDKKVAELLGDVQVIETVAIATETEITTGGTE